MKTKVFLGLLALLIIGSVSSCCIFHKDPDPDGISYYLSISFQDASGNDLVKGIGLANLDLDKIGEDSIFSGVVKEDAYILNIVASEPCQDLTQPRKKGHFKLLLVMDNSEGYWFLSTHVGFDIEQCPDEKIITYKWKCPYIFGYGAEYVVVTYWEIPELNNKHVYAKCVRVEFEDQVYIPVTPEGSYSSKVVIIWEGRRNE